MRIISFRRQPVSSISWDWIYFPILYEKKDFFAPTVSVRAPVVFAKASAVSAKAEAVSVKGRHSNQPT
jgi:hypothetical protein